MTESRNGYFDHIAVAVRQWSDGYPVFVDELGGRSVSEGDAGEFAPEQIGFVGGVKVELLAPGSMEGGFVTRYLDKGGPAPHHLTFMVPDLGRFERVAQSYGLPLLGAFLDIPHRPEAFVHPKGSGFGTLLQAMELYDTDVAHAAAAGAAPAGAAHHRLEWVALRVGDLDLATTFLVEATDATLNEADSPPRSAVLEWDGDRRLVLLDESHGTAGVDHVAFGSQDAAPRVPAAALTEGANHRVIEAPGVRVLVLQ